MTSHFSKIEAIKKSFQILSIRPKSGGVVFSNRLQSHVWIGFARPELKSIEFQREKSMFAQRRRTLWGKESLLDRYRDVTRPDFGGFCSKSDFCKIGM